MENFWAVVEFIGALIIFAFTLWLVWFLPKKRVKTMAKKHNLKEPKGWIFAIIFLSWWAVFFYWITLPKKNKEK